VFARWGNFVPIVLALLLTAGGIVLGRGGIVLGKRRR
jgi:hypothetical protein